MDVDDYYGHYNHYDDYVFLAARKALITFLLSLSKGMCFRLLFLAPLSAITIYILPIAFSIRLLYSYLKCELFKDVS